MAAARTCVVVAACLLGVLVSGVSANQREEFESAFQTQISDLLADTTKVAQSTWDLVCPGCDTTQPAQNHSRNADKDIYFSPQFQVNDPFINLIAGIGQVSRYQFVDAINDDLNDGTFFENDGFAQLMSVNFKQLQSVYQQFYEDIDSYWQGDAYMTNASLSGGGGMGFGVQINCGQQVVVSIGGGCGTGFAGKYGKLSAGGGGGAGIQAYGSLGNKLFDAGGGGGGGVNFVDASIVVPNWGTSTDQGQELDQNVWTQLAQQMSTCYKEGNLILRAAGGGGGGMFAATAANTPSNDDDSVGDDDDIPAPEGNKAVVYGGGWGYSFTLASPSGSGTAPGPVVGNELGHVATGCHSTCESTTAPDGFYACFCPCIKRGFQNLDQPWASHITCYGTSATDDDGEMFLH